MKKWFFCTAALALQLTAVAQKLTPEDYIEQYKDLAIREMKRMGVPAAIKLAQGLLETENGNSPLLKKSNNHFGIKCKSNWTGGGVSHDDDALGECFRTYASAEESYRDHSNFLRGSERYAPLFRLDPADYKGWAYGLKKAGYATNPRYPEKLIQSIEKYNLQQYSLVAVNEVPKYDAAQYKDDPEVPFVYTETEAAAPEAASSLTPEKETVTYINRSRCVRAARGTSLLAIASRFDIPLAKLLQYNDLSQDGLLQKDQPVFLEKKQLEGSTAEYLSREGETLYDIAQQQGIQLEWLATYNRLSPHTVISPGTRLSLKPGALTAANRPAPQASAATGKTHRVQPREGLFAIARQYGVTVQQLREWNSLESDQLSIGQQLIVSK